MAQQSNLERLSIEERNREVVNSTYNKDNEYSSNHKDALGPDTPNANGEEKGKGTNTSLGYLTPTSNKNPNSPINYSTIITDKGGSVDDITTREQHKIRNLYSAENEYGVNSVDTSKNVSEGQIVIR